MKKQEIASRFSYAAEEYSEYTPVQTQLRTKVLNELLSRLTGPSSITDLGCGDGELAGMMLDAFPDARITGVDLSGGMIKKAMREYRDPRVNFIQEDLETYHPQNQVEAVTANASFQWAADLPALFKHISSWVLPEGLLIFTVFTKETFKEFKTAAEGLGGKFGIDLPEDEKIDQWCRKAGWDVLKTEADVQVSYYHDLRRFLVDHKKSGSSFSPVKDKKINVFRLLREYPRMEEGYPVSYHTLLKVCRKK